MRFAPLFILLAAGTALLSPGVCHAFSWEDLKKLIESRSFAGIPELVAALPEEFRQNYILQTATESPQPASKDAPRVLLHSNDMKMIIGISGGPEGIPISQLVEVAEFNEQRANYEPRVIEFGKEKVRAFDSPNELFPRNHPKNCFTCHGEVFRLIWDSYPFWPRSYGVEEHSFDGVEEAAFARFLSGNGSRGIYKELIYKESTGLQKSVSIQERRNIAFTRLANAKNEQRIYERMKGNPVVSQYRKEIFTAMSLGDRGDFERFLPEELRAEFSEAYPRLLRDIQERTRANFERKQAAYEKIFGSKLRRGVSDIDTEHAPRFARLKFFMDKAGISMADWGMTRQLGTYSLSDPLHPFNDLQVRFYDEMILPEYPWMIESMNTLSSPFENHLRWPGGPGAPEIRTFSYGITMEEAVEQLHRGPRPLPIVEEPATVSLAAKDSLAKRCLRRMLGWLSRARPSAR